jgi:tetratricopeptide (TPR) repeat protein
MADPIITADLAAVPEPNATPAAVSAAGGRYVLGAEIACGGMGVVYRATDTAFGREVAVKVLRDRYAPDSGTARRFADEARITGQLQHPGIPPAHDLGVLPDGRPFLAMKLIKGATLDQLLKGRPNPAADRGRFVAVFEQVCQAIAYAHAHGVIHRDLKPSNVMVGSFGEVQVMDWGLAKVLAAREPEGSRDPEETQALATEIRGLRDADRAATQAGSVLGTPAFMPPEQALGAVGKIDARSDVFGLGAILAVILTGKPPFAASSAETSRIRAAQGKLEDCFARLDASGADPELIALCRRCLSPEQADRPADAGEVAAAVAELRAAAEDRAKRAEVRRARAAVRAAEERKRRRVQLVLGGVVLASVLTGGTAAAWLWWRADRAFARVTDEQAKTVAALSAAEKAQEKTLDALRKLTNEMVGDHLAQQPTLSDRERLFLRDVLRLWEEAADARDDTPRALALRAEGAFRVGSIHSRLSDWAAAVPAARRAVELYGLLAAAEPTVPDYQLALATARGQLAHALIGTGFPAEAAAEYRAALAVLERLVVDHPGVLAYLHELGRTHLNLGVHQFNVHRALPQAEAEYRAALALFERLVAAQPTAQYRFSLSFAQDNLGQVLSATKRPDEAEAAFRAALTVRRELAAAYPSVSTYRIWIAHTHNNLGMVFRKAGRWADAEVEHRAALAVQRQLAAEYPAVPLRRVSVANTLDDLVTLFGEAGRWADAEAEYRAARAARRELVTSYPDTQQYQVDMAGSLHRFIRVQIARKEFAAAAALLTEAQPLLLAALKANPQHPGYRRFCHTHLSTACNVLTHLGDHAGLAATAAELIQLNFLPARDRYEAACYLARCVPLAERDDRLPGPDRQPLARQYADRAMGYLQDAVRHGYQDAGRLKAEPDLEPLRSRGDFQQLLDGVQRQTPPPEVAPAPRER